MTKLDPKAAATIVIDHFFPQEPEKVREAMAFLVADFLACLNAIVLNMPEP